jgi:hypothetical protein
MKPDIVVVGASAGGVVALQSLASQLPPDLQAAIFAVIHLSPNRLSYHFEQLFWGMRFLCGYFYAVIKTGLAQATFKPGCMLSRVLDGRDYSFTAWERES